MLNDANDVADPFLSTIVKSCAARTSGERTCASSAAVPTVGWPAKGSSRAGVKILTLAVLIGFRGSKTNTVSERLNSAAIACMRASSSPTESSTTASGLPASGVSVNTSTVKKRRVIAGIPRSPIAALGVRPRLWGAATRNGQVVRQAVQAAHADKGVIDIRHKRRRADRL
jgi:transcription antitermination factor NusA-like protein